MKLVHLVGFTTKNLDILQGASACGIAIVPILASNTAESRLFSYFCVGYHLCNLAHPTAADVSSSHAQMQGPLKVQNTGPFQVERTFYIEEQEGRMSSCRHVKPNIL